MMKGMVSGIAALVVAVSFPASAVAQWTAKAEAGLVAARGNSNSDSANTKLDVAREFTKWRQSIGGSAVYVSDTTGATSQRWELRGQSDYDFHPRGFWFGSGRHEEDRFSGFEHQRTFGSGLGWRFYDDPITRLVAQVGVGYKTFTTRASLEDDGLTVIPRARDEQVIGQGKVDFEHQLTQTAKVLNTLVVETGGENTFVHNDVSLQVTVISSLALALGYSVRYNTDPPAGFDTTDRLTTLNLVYELN
ncbi:MAG: DUF481 domain-containing protein [Steroidobacter sp.]